MKSYKRAKLDQPTALTDGLAADSVRARKRPVVLALTAATPPSGAVPRALRQEGFERVERAVVLVKYRNGRLFSLAVNPSRSRPARNLDP